MVFAVLLLLVIALLFGIGLAVKAAVFLIWVAALLAVVWIVGWFIGRGAEAGAASGRRRWYSW